MGIFKQGAQAVRVPHIPGIIPDIVVVFGCFPGQNQPSDFCVCILKEPNQGAPQMSLGSGYNIDPFHLPYLL